MSSKRKGQKATPPPTPQQDEGQDDEVYDESQEVYAWVIRINPRYEQCAERLMQEQITMDHLKDLDIPTLRNLGVSLGCAMDIRRTLNEQNPQILPEQTSE